MRFIPKTLSIALLALSCSAVAKQAVDTGHGGAVATISDEATHAAMEILNAGGNAIDAAVAAAATLGVTDPFSCGVGGGGFMLIYSAKEKRVVALDHREVAPASFHSAVFTQNGAPMKWRDAVPNGLSVGVPGTVRGWQAALQRYGTLSFDDVLKPAIRIAEEGFEVGPNFHRINAKNEAKFSRFKTTAALYLKAGKALPVGTHFRNSALANTYRLLAQKGPDIFYHGEIAQDIVSTVNQPPATEGINVLAGNMTINDLRDYEARFRRPIHSTYRGYDVYGMPTPSSGGITIAEALNILETFNLAEKPRSEVEHLYIEASRLSFADRNAYIGDEAFVDFPQDGMLSKEYAKIRATQIGEASIAAAAEPGDPYPFENDLSIPLRPAKAAAQREEPMHTTHLAVADREGNIVAYTFTIEDWGGSGIVVPERGFILNNELTDFDFSGPHPNVPEAYKRPRSSMSPTIVLKNGRPAFTIGSPGGSTIITTVLQIIVNHVDLGLPLADAIAAPRLSQRNGATTLVETLLEFPGSDAAKALAAKGHEWTEKDQIGAANGIQFNDDGSITAVSEPLRHGGGSAITQKQ